MTRKAPQPMLARINPPQIVDPEDPAYLSCCIRALVPSIEGLIDVAVEAGWSRSKTMAAIMLATGCQMEREGLHYGWLDSGEDSDGRPPACALN